eukprot:TRINITY_DN1760_c0_g2_i1.p1 TRINITY_DN1760_c0_g2~~TRINITY_DN1760_c0_g2_i1.p1  ORF type:complete len:176 (+),score=42.91 TRINITY_DN1760_c0_g2_i1:78-605(+)
MAPKKTEAAAPKKAAAPAPAKKAAAPVAKKGAEAAKVTKATKAAKVAREGVKQVKHRKIRTSVHFSRPKTLRLARNPKYPRRSTPRVVTFDDYMVIKHPHTTETAMKKIEDDNTLVFIVDNRCNKSHIKRAVERLYQVKAVKVNTLVRPDGVKKAYVRLAADHDALDVSNRIGMI